MDFQEAPRVRRNKNSIANSQVGKQRAKIEIQSTVFWHKRQLNQKGIDFKSLRDLDRTRFHRFKPVKKQFARKKFRITI
jgi:hypothetical protein